MSGVRTQTTTARSNTRPKPWESRWQHPCVVVDTVALWFPETYDVPEATRLALPEPLTAGEIADYAADYAVGHDGRDLGQVWITPRMSDALGLAIDADVTTAVTSATDDANQAQKANRAVFDRLTEAGGPVLASLAEAGWEVANRDARRDRVWLQPRTTIRRSDGRALQLVFAEYALMWDPQGTGPYRDPIPDADDAPEEYARELVRRLGRLHALLGVPWGASAGATGAGLADDVRPPSWPKEPGELPQLDNIAGQNVLEPTWSAHRRPSGSELENAGWLHSFDGRLAWLTRASSADLGCGRPDYHSGAEAAKKAAEGKQPGLWRVVLPSWDHAMLPAPHPLMRPDEEVIRWITTPSLRLLTKDAELDVKVLEAWIYPERHRALDAWAQRLKKALVGDARAAKDALQRAEQAGDEVEAAWWRHRHWLLSHGARGAAAAARTAGDEAEAATWAAVAASAKSVFSVYLQRLSSSLTLRTSGAYRHHHQATWPATVIAEQRRMDWIKIRDHGERTGHYPIAMTRNDEYFYLSESADPVSVAPDTDTGALGKLRAKEAPLELTDDIKAELAREPRRVEVLWDRHCGRGRSVA